MVSWTDICRWDPSEIALVARRFTEAAHSLTVGIENLERELQRLDWSGDAGGAAKADLRRAIAENQASARQLEYVGQCVADTTDRMYPIRAVVRECESTSTDNTMPIDQDGAVTDGLTAYTTGAEDAWDAGRSRMRILRELEASVAEVIRRASEIDTETASRLRSAVAPEPFTPSAPVATAPASSTSPGVAAANAIWWDLLTRSERTSILVDDPGSIGNLDGIPADVRDAANRRMLVSERDRLEQVAEDLESTLQANVFGGLFDNADAGLEQTLKRIAALDEIADVLDEGHRQLLVLDNSSATDTLAAIAVGNVHTASHVAVFVPGLDSEVGADVRRYDGDMDSLRSTVQQLVPPAETVACVTWMDYQAPQLGWSLFDPRRTVMSPLAAATGAPRLTSFLDGLDAARSQDPHLTLLGHSYGSLTAALALRGADTTGVDDMVALGSPGLGFDNVERSSVPPGHLFVAETCDDLVADTGLFGADPSEIDGVRPLATRSGGDHADSHGHSEYLSEGTVTQQNVALVVSGRTEEVY